MPICSLVYLVCKFEKWKKVRGKRMEGEKGGRYSEAGNPELRRRGKGEGMGLWEWEWKGG